MHRIFTGEWQIFDHILACSKSNEKLEGQSPGNFSGRRRASARKLWKPRVPSFTEPHSRSSIDRAHVDMLLLQEVGHPSCVSLSPGLEEQIHQIYQRLVRQRESVQIHFLDLVVIVLALDHLERLRLIQSPAPRNSVPKKSIPTVNS